MEGVIHVSEEEPSTDVDFAFEWRDVLVREDVWVTDEYDIFEVLGRGKFGEVKRCVNRENGMSFAAKFIATPTVQDREEVYHELEITKKLKHRRLLQIYDAFSIGTNMCLVLEVIMGGELFDRVLCDDFILTEKACVCFMRQVCDGVDYMHKHNIIHLDMKPENILCLSKTGNRIKIIDFGLAREYDSKKDMRVLFGTPEFMAPEVVNYDPISFSTDMWSIGVITYVLLTGLSPFMGDSDADTLTNVIKCDYDFNYDEFEEISEAAKDFIEKLLIVNKKKRMSAEECLEHPWLKVKEPKSLEMKKDKLRHYVYRHKWQKAIHAIIALRRMGMDFQKLSDEAPKKPELPPKPRMVNVGKFFNKGKENFNKKDQAFNGILKHCSKSPQPQTIEKTQDKPRAKPKVAPRIQNGPVLVETKNRKQNENSYSDVNHKHSVVPLAAKNGFKPVDNDKLKALNKTAPIVTVSDTTTEQIGKSSDKIDNKKITKDVNCLEQVDNSFEAGKTKSGKNVTDSSSNKVANLKSTIDSKDTVAKWDSKHLLDNSTKSKNPISDTKFINTKTPHTEKHIEKSVNDENQKLNKQNDNHTKVKNETAEVPMDTSLSDSSQSERRCVVQKRTSSNASCNSDSSDANRDENLNRVLRKRPNMCSVLDRIRAFESGQNENTKPPIAPREETVDISNLKKTGQNARKWQKGNDRYIVVNKMQDTLKFFTVDDQRELISSGFSRSRENSPNLMMVS